MPTRNDFFARPIRTQMSDYILHMLQEAGLQEDTDEYLSSQYLLNAVNRYIFMTLDTLGEILRDLERDKKIKRKDSETEGTSKPTEETLWAFNA